MVDADPSLLPDPPFDRAGRDGYRTPMQWDGSPTAGFTSGAPWLPIVDGGTRNVDAQRADPGSLLAFYRTLIAARHASPALAVGTHRSLFGVGPDVLAWVREADGERLLVLLNLGDGPAPCAMPLGRIGAEGGEVVVATSDRAGSVDLPSLELAPLEGIALRLD